jgi:NADPH-dependent 2,4-dienoyl-CoA reductase/sulfur reductase-like enzyme
VAGSYVELSDGERLHYDDLVIATGTQPRPSPWGAPPGVHYLRTLRDAAALQGDLHRGGPLVVIGAGFIGAEVAATARGMGIEEVTLVDPEPAPMSRVITGAVAEYFAAMHRARGVSTRFGTGVTGIDCTAEGLAVQLTDSSRVRAATVVVGIGAMPNDGWLASSGLRLDDGVICDAYSRALGAPQVHAVGDVARWFHRKHDAFVRAEHWTNAVEQASCVASNIAHPGDLRTYEPVEYVWSDQYDSKIQVVGRVSPELPHIILDQAGPASSFAVLYAAPDGVLAGVLTVNWPRAAIICRRAVTTRTPLDEVRRMIATPARAGQGRHGAAIQAAGKATSRGDADVR